MLNKDVKVFGDPMRASIQNLHQIWGNTQGKPWGINGVL